MTFEIVLVFGILFSCLILFVTEWVRMDVVALMVLSSLAIFGLVSPAEAISGFSNPAVITVWAMYIMSEGLTRAGIADQIGSLVMHVSGRSEVRIITIFMISAGILSAFMNNIAVAALMLPVVIEVARRSAIAPSRVLMPLAYGTLLGGLMTLIGTPPNLLVSIALREAGESEFEFFDFAFIGVPILLIGTAFVALLGRHLLPVTDTTKILEKQRNLHDEYGLQERIFVLQVPANALLIDKTIAESGLTWAAGLVIIALTRAGRTEVLPKANTLLQAGDILLTQGRFDHFERLRSWSTLTIEREAPILHERLLADNKLAELTVADNATLIGKPLHHRAFREHFGVNVLAIRRTGLVRRTRLAEMVITTDDRLLVQGTPQALAALHDASEFSTVGPVTPKEMRENYQLDARLFVLHVPNDTPLSGSTLAENQLGDAFDFRLLGIFRNGEVLESPASEEIIQSGDLLLIQGRESDLDMLRGLQQLERLSDVSPYLDVFEQGELDLVEATLHPHSKFVGRRVEDLQLDEHYHVELAAIWRAGKPHRSSLRTMTLQSGDALLFVGPKVRLVGLNDIEDLLILNPVQVKPINTRKAPIAGALMLLVVAAVIMELLPISIAAIAGATLMVLSGCLNMEQAHRAIEWRSIFLIAGMLPLGTAMQHTGAATLLAQSILDLLGPGGPWVVIAGLYIITTLGALMMPTVALVLIMAPIALTLSTTLGVSAQTVMMVVAIAATSLASPVSHPANTLVMGPGGYRFIDYLKLGIPLTLVVSIVTIFLLPIFWPLEIQ
ncbi:SLC13 family permease [Nitrosomonas supralitoralis]|uniref:SLC13 family permease n=1 Tax=Nitrosomonas supralitoralis TaxID=2116706 RepID=A0A2P7NSS9_9PROT|nr:SLC13 family permease [Nitrosomonas supralitoralis]PSJ16533.1 SLC13 family permease [Nitrosomonas supralitoralis]